MYRWKGLSVSVTTPIESLGKCAHMFERQYFWKGTADNQNFQTQLIPCAELVTLEKWCVQEKQTLELERADFLREKQEWSRYLEEQQQEIRECRQALVHFVSDQVALEVAQFREILQQLLPSTEKDVFSTPGRVYEGQDVSDWDGRPAIQAPLSSQLCGGKPPPSPPALSGPPPPPRDGSGLGIASATSVQQPLMRKNPPVRMKHPPLLSGGSPLETKAPPQAPSYPKESYESGPVPKKAPPRLGHF